MTGSTGWGKGCGSRVRRPSLCGVALALILLPLAGEMPAAGLALPVPSPRGLCHRDHGHGAYRYRTVVPCPR